MTNHSHNWTIRGTLSGVPTHLKRFQQYLIEHDFTPAFCNQLTEPVPMILTGLIFGYHSSSSAEVLSISSSMPAFAIEYQVMLTPLIKEFTTVLNTVERNGDRVKTKLCSALLITSVAGGLVSAGLFTFSRSSILKRINITDNLADTVARYFALGGWLPLPMGLSFVFERLALSDKGYRRYFPAINKFAWTIGLLIPVLLLTKFRIWEPSMFLLGGLVLTRSCFILACYLIPYWRLVTCGVRWSQLSNDLSQFFKNMLWIVPGVSWHGVGFYLNRCILNLGSVQAKAQSAVSLYNAGIFSLANAIGTCVQKTMTLQFQAKQRHKLRYSACCSTLAAIIPTITLAVTGLFAQSKLLGPFYNENKAPSTLIPKNDHANINLDGVFSIIVAQAGITGLMLTVCQWYMAIDHRSIPAVISFLSSLLSGLGLLLADHNILPANIQSLNILYTGGVFFAFVILVFIWLYLIQTNRILSEEKKTPLLTESKMTDVESINAAPDLQATSETNNSWGTWLKDQLYRLQCCFN